MNNKSLLYLWQDRTLFLGILSDSLRLSQGAATLLVSLEGKFEVTIPDKDIFFESTSVLLKPGSLVHINTRKQTIANINLDVMGADFHALSELNPKQSGDVYHDLELENIFHDTLTQIFTKAPDSAATKKLIENTFRKLPCGIYVIDQRVRKVVDIIQNEIIENLSIEYLAKQVNLSVPGLSKLFKKQTGVPIRRYRQWHRLFVTATEIGKGRNLTDAALTAGFVDLSHCTHTFNLMLGMKPSYFLLRPNEIKVITEQSNNLSCKKYKAFIY